MNKPRTVEGRWWIFGPEKDSYFGVLEFDPEDGCKLEVKVSHEISVKDVFLQGSDRCRIPVPQRIQGQDEHGKPVVLLGSYCQRYTVSSDLTTYEISAIRILLGCTDASEEPKFDNAYIEYSLVHQSSAFRTKGRAPESRVC